MARQALSHPATPQEVRAYLKTHPDVGMHDAKRAVERKKMSAEPYADGSKALSHPSPALEAVRKAQASSRGVLEWMKGFNYHKKFPAFVESVEALDAAFGKGEE